MKNLYEKHKALMRKRDDEVRQMIADEVSLSDIGKKIGVTRQRAWAIAQRLKNSGLPHKGE